MFAQVADGLLGARGVARSDHDRHPGLPEPQRQTETQRSRAADDADGWWHGGGVYGSRGESGSLDVGSAVHGRRPGDRPRGHLRVRSGGCAADRRRRDAASARAVDARDDRDDGAHRRAARVPAGGGGQGDRRVRGVRQARRRRGRGDAVGGPWLASRRSSTTASCGSRSRCRPTTGARSASGRTSGGSSRPDSPARLAPGPVLISGRRASEVCRSCSGSGAGRRSSGRRRGEDAAGLQASAVDRLGLADPVRAAARVEGRPRPPVLAGGADAGSPLAVPAVRAPR